MVQVSTQVNSPSDDSTNTLKADYETARQQLDEQIKNMSPKVVDTLKEYNIKFPRSNNGDLILSDAERKEAYSQISKLRPKYDAKGGDNPNLAAIQMLDNWLVADARLDAAERKLNDTIPDSKQNIQRDLSSAKMTLTDVDAIYKTYTSQVTVARANEAGRMAELSSTYNQQRQRLGQIGQQYNQEFGQSTGFNFSSNGQISDNFREKMTDRLKSTNASAAEKSQLNLMLQVDGYLDRVPEIMSKINNRVTSGNFVRTPELRAKANQELKNAQTFTLSNYEQKTK